MITETLISHADQYFAQLIRDIDCASHGIQFEVYIFENDRTGKQFIRALARAAKRGVGVRLILDGVGSWELPGSVVDDLIASGVEVEIFHPLPWSETSQSKPWHRLFELMNRRNHRKVVLIDNKIAWIGSLNVTQDHLAPEQGGEGWRDIAIRIAGANFEDLRRSFNIIWKFSRKMKNIQRSKFKAATPEVFRINLGIVHRRRLSVDLHCRLLEANKTIWIINPYFVPNQKILNALKKAAIDGVSVQLILPQRSDVLFMEWASSVFYRDLLKAGCQIFELQDEILHAKVTIVDEWMCLGSSNLNQRSLLHDLECDYVLQQTGTRQALLDYFLETKGRSLKVTREGLIFYKFWKLLLGRVVLILKYWL